MITKNLEKIRAFTQENPELLKSHHFLFNCPLNKEFDKAEALVIGINPGESYDDWNFQDNLPTEESNEFDFHEEMGHERTEMRWSRLCKEYLGSNKIVLSEFFFWSSRQVGEDTNKGESFNERFGYKFKKCPHFYFCKEQNIDLIHFHKPKIIIAPGTSYADFFAKIYKLDHIKTLKCESDKRNRKTIIHYEFMNIPFLFTPHWSSGYVSTVEKSFIQDYIHDIYSQIKR